MDGNADAEAGERAGERGFEEGRAVSFGGAGFDGCHMLTVALEPVFNHEAELVVGRAQGEAVLAGDIEEWRDIKLLIDIMLAACAIGFGNIAMALAERVVHLVDDAAQLARLVISIPERDRGEFVEQVPRQRDQADRAALKRNARFGKHVLRPRT